MNSTPRCALLLLAVCGICLPGAAGEFYLRFLSLVNTNQRPLRPLTFAALVDTNNTESKITNAAVDLERLRLDAGISGVRLGMTMDETVARWGKPRRGYYPGCLHGLTTFFYNDVGLGFEGDRLETIQITPQQKFGGGLSTESKLQDFVRVLGPPTNRRDANSDSCNLVYLSAGANLRLDFHGEELMNIYLERTASRAEPWNGTAGANEQR